MTGNNALTHTFILVLIPKQGHGNSHGEKDVVLGMWSFMIHGWVPLQRSSQREVRVCKQREAAQYWKQKWRCMSKVEEGVTSQVPGNPGDLEETRG